MSASEQDFQTKKDFPIIIIGTGAAGLMAARELLRAGKKTVLLEASSIPGGRIRTLYDKEFREPVEAGAEFIHGNLPLTLQLLEEAGIPVQPLEGKMIRVKDGKRGGEGAFAEGWEELLQRMQQLEKDMPIAEFLSSWFGGNKYAALRDSVRGFAEGYDLADINTASTKTLYEEWKHEEEQEYRIKGGYRQLIDYLVADCRNRGCTIHFSCTVKKIEWDKLPVFIETADGRSFTGSKTIVTVPLGVLQSRPEEQASIQFFPAVEDHLDAARKIGYGTVIKILLQFRQPFWTKKNKNIGFILSDEPVPTWWTQSPDKNPLLTGWLGGPQKMRLAHAGRATLLSSPPDEEDLLDLSLGSLSVIFQLNKASLRKELVAWKIIDWASEPFALGGYSFDKVESAAARKIVSRPIRQVLFFAGEALYEGASPGTVEAALSSGKEVADKIIRHTDHVMP